MLADPDLSVLSSAEKDALLRRLLSHLHDLTKRVTALEAENAALRDRLNLPPKIAGTQDQRRADQSAQRQGASRCGPRSASEPDAAP